MIGWNTPELTSMQFQVVRGCFDIAIEIRLLTYLKLYTKLLTFHIPAVQDECSLFAMKNNQIQTRAWISFRTLKAKQIIDAWKMCVD